MNTNQTCEFDIDSHCFCYVRCLECELSAQWHIWYKDCVLSLAGGNIAYNSFCIEHAIIEMKNGRNGYFVARIKPIENNPRTCKCTK